jgi:hypothetical protein
LDTFVPGKDFHCVSYRHLKLNDTDGDGIVDKNGGNKEPDNGWDIDGDGDNILDSIDNDLNLKPTPFSLKDNTATATAVSTIGASTSNVLFSTKTTNAVATITSN